MGVRVETQAEPIPGYRLLERLGGGGFGEVWKATAPGGLLKAIKFVYGDLQATTEEGLRAEQELKALSRVKTVRHPYILSLERFDIINGQLMIVMELADRNLYDRYRECRTQGLQGIPRDELLGYMEETAEALDLMNIQYQLQHLDIKPQNLFLVYNHAKVADFGLVKDLAGMMASLTGGVTPVYAAPETFDGWVSRYCDQYSLAIVYQELLTGQRPFLNGSIAQLIQQHLQATPNLSALAPSDREAIARALSKNPDERFPSCSELIRALRQRPAAPAAPPALRPAVERAGDSTADAPSPDATAFNGRREAGVPAAPGNGAAPGTATQWIQIHRDAPALPSEATPERHAHEEVEGDGVLVPALVLGLGQQGLSVLKALRETLQDSHNGVESLPNLRLLYLDTDPDATRTAADGPPGTSLSSNEVLIAKLNRPAHYLRSHEGKAKLEPWFNQRMLYRIPRSLHTTGFRALGRLAFLDNYRLIARRLRHELEDCCQPQQLAEAAERTGLGLRTSRPRVYIVTGLAGGTGSGMFLDTAYVVRRLLRELGFDRHEIIGLFLLPPVDRGGTHTLAVGNTFAALTELNHFSAPSTVFSARYDEREKPLVDATPPFDRSFLVPLGAGEDRAAEEAADLTADYLYRDLLTDLGRAADELRSRTPVSHRQPWTLACQSFGLHRISLPRQALLQQVARRLCHEVVKGWMSKDAAPVRDAVSAAVAEQWTKRQIGGEHIIALLERAAVDSLGQTPDTVFAPLLEALLPAEAPDARPLWAQGRELMVRVEHILGRPEENLGPGNGRLAEPLALAAEQAVHLWSDKLAGFAVRLVEEPHLRLAGAEEAVRQLITAAERELQQYEPLAKEFASRSQEARGRILTLLEAAPPVMTSGRKPSPLPGTLVELLRVYPKWRFQALVLGQVVSVLVSLRGQLSDQLREINYCRDRLGELQRSFADAEKDRPVRDGLAFSRNLFPSGCRTLADAVELLLETVTPEDLQTLDGRVQRLITEQFSALVHVCMTSANLLDRFEAAMQHEAEEYVATRLAGTSVAEMFLTQHQQEGAVQADLAAAFENACPLVGGHASREREIAVLAVPPGDAGGRVRDLAREVLEGVELADARTTADILFYRERTQVFLSELEQLGPLARDAYKQLASLEHFTPHSRLDVEQWRAASAG